MTNIHFTCLICLSGPSTQTTIGINRVAFNSQITFNTSGPFRQIAYAQIINDDVALEKDEIVHLTVIIQSPSSGVMLSHFPTTVVRIVDDDDRKPSILIAVMTGGCLVLHVV